MASCPWEQWPPLRGLALGLGQPGALVPWVSNGLALGKRSPTIPDAEMTWGAALRLRPGTWNITQKDRRRSAQSEREMLGRSEPEKVGLHHSRVDLWSNHGKLPTDVTLFSKSRSVLKEKNLLFLFHQSSIIFFLINKYTYIYRCKKNNNEINRNKNQNKKTHYTRTPARLLGLFGYLVPAWFFFCVGMKFFRARNASSASS